MLSGCALLNALGEGEGANDDAGVDVFDADPGAIDGGPGASAWDETSWDEGTWS